MENTSFLLIDESVLPEVYQKVIRVNQLLETGEASNTSEAVKMAGISRSVYYKYKNAVFPYTKGNGLHYDGAGRVKRQARRACEPFDGIL